MTPEEHYAEAERLAKLGAAMWVSPEGDYDDAEAPSAEELATRAVVQDQALRQAAVVLAEAQVHATLALHRPRAEFHFSPGAGAGGGMAEQLGEWIKAARVRKEQG